MVNGEEAEKTTRTELLTKTTTVSSLQDIKREQNTKISAYAPKQYATGAKIITP